MTRTDAYDLIDAERDRQDAAWKDRSQYARYAPHILILEEKVARLRSIWYSSASEELQNEIVKIAAIAVRALEEVE